MKLLVVALHFPYRRQQELGIRMGRLHIAAVTLILNRQADGVEAVMDVSKKNLEFDSKRPSEQRTRSVHMIYSHLWDEVDTRFAVKTGRAKASKLQMRQKVIVQRGQVATVLMDLRQKRSHLYHEAWLCAPKICNGARAMDVWPAMADAMPKWFNPLFDEINKLLDVVDSATLCPLPDRHAGNVLILKYICYFIEHVVTPKMGPRLNILPDTCYCHYHHRKKAKVKVMLVHTTRHFSIANLYR